MRSYLHVDDCVDAIQPSLELEFDDPREGDGDHTHADSSNANALLEDLTYIRENLDYGKYMNRRLHSWVFARLTDRIEDKALEASIPVEFVNPRYTSQTCHVCGHIGRRGSQAEFKCTNPECWITEYQADINAAANIAGRVDPWGESVPWKPERDDSPRNGSASDSATGHRTPSRQSRQTTLAVFES